MLQARDIHKFYGNGESRLHVLKGIDLKIEAGDFVAIMGPSGAGKSTLLHILGGLDAPDDGDVHLDGEDVYALNDAERAGIRNRKIGFVFQFYHLLPEFNALENVVLPAVVRRNQSDLKKVEKHGKELLARVGLSARAGHKPQQLSGGEQQRVAVARALVNKPKIIFCDEPTGNLDSQNGQEIIDLLEGLNKENQQTMVIITHDPYVAKKAKRVIQIQDGRLG